MLLQDWKKKRKNRNKRRKTKKKKKKKRILKRKRKIFVFTGDFGKQVFTEMLDVGYWLGKQSDPDKSRTHFHLGYLPKAGKVDDNTTRKKQAHEMTGVLLTILCYCLLQVHYKKCLTKLEEMCWLSLSPFLSK